MKLIMYHCPGTPTVGPSPPVSPATLSSWIEVKTMRWAAVPTAEREPFTQRVPNWPLNFTTTPGSIVSVRPAAIVAFPSTT